MSENPVYETHLILELLEPSNTVSRLEINEDKFQIIESLAFLFIHYVDKECQAATANYSTSTNQKNL